MSSGLLKPQEIAVLGGHARVFRRGAGGPCVFWGNAAEVHSPEDQRRVFGLACKQLGERPFALAVYEPGEWDACFSPWEATVEPYGKHGSARHFAGKGPSTLKWLEEEVCPAVFAHLGVKPAQVGLAGYSLGGLFAVWALCNQSGGMFCGAASCSGSFWFPGWEEHLGTATFPEGSAVFQSLGRKEERVVDPLISRVGSSNRELAARLAGDPRVRASSFELVDGGHFHDVAGRLARGVSWMVCNLDPDKCQDVSEG